MKLPKKVSGIKQFADVIDILGQASDSFRNDRERPYNGQPWTDLGKRGKTEVKSLTMRDIRDCFVMAFLDSIPDPRWHQKVEDGTWCVNDLYEALSDDPHFDPLAVAQNLTCHIEKMMGIFPNISKKLLEQGLKGIPIIEMDL